MYQTLTGKELKSRMEAGEDMILVETLPPRYFDAEHLPGAINIPHDEMRKRAPVELPDKQAMIVVYCASTECQNSKIAAQILDADGYSNVFEYVDGKRDWLEAGFPLEGQNQNREAS
ncbi:rhodanese-like domain-containing protein [Nitrincola sp. MINF-07-Sa-05]|uniref:rhodanese-like domain-containing protein n=1 Tax=Nitrincola salilacus TaxID=3400273 RepID=UPI003917D1B1